MENNVASQLSRSLNVARRAIASFDLTAARSSVESDARQMPAPSPASRSQPSKLKKLKAKTFSHDRGQPVSLDNLEQLASVKGLFIGWRTAVRTLLKAYDEVSAVAAKRSAHRVAYEAAFTRLYEEQRNAVIARGAHMPEVIAMRLAKMKIGQPKPLADLRYQVEAFWISIEIRLVFVELAGVVIGAIPENLKESNELQLRWSTFTRELLRSVSHDAEVALSVAEKTSSPRQVAKSYIILHRCRFATFQFNFQMSFRRGLTAERREELRSALEGHVSHFEAETTDARAHYMERVSGSHEAKLEWITTNFDASAAEIADSWSSIERAVNGGVFYTEVSLQEKQSIVKALDFAQHGHFYRCRNGHPYVITECGGAMESSQCPECGAPVGGGSHRLHHGNARDTDLEALNVTAQPDHWRWVERDGRFPWA